MRAKKKKKYAVDHRLRERSFVGAQHVYNDQISIVASKKERKSNFSVPTLFSRAASNGFEMRASHENNNDTSSNRIDTAV